MLKLTKTGIGLLTRQYRSVLKKCWLINVGIWNLVTNLVSNAASAVCGGMNTLRGSSKNSAKEFLELIAALQNCNFLNDEVLKNMAKNFIETIKLPAAELLNTLTGGTFSAISASNVLDGFSMKRIFKTKLVATTAIGLAVAAVMMPTEAEADALFCLGGSVCNGSSYSNTGTLVYTASDYVYTDGTYYYYVPQWLANLGYGSYRTVRQSLYGGGYNEYTSYFYTGSSSVYVDISTAVAQAAGNAKITGAATTIAQNNLTVSRALISDSSGKVAVSSVTSTQLGYLSGVTSNIQTQLNAKAAKATTLSGYGITNAYTKTEVDNLISQAGGSSVVLSNYYTKSETYSKDQINNIQSLNNYYRKNKKSGILNGVKEGKIGNEIGDNFALNNDNFATTTFLRAI